MTTNSARSKCQPELVALLVVDEVQRAEGVGVAMERVLAERRPDEVQQGIPFVQGADRGVGRDQVVGDGGLRGALHHPPWIVLGQRRVDVLEVDVVDRLVGEGHVRQRERLADEPVHRVCAQEPLELAGAGRRRDRRDSARPVRCRQRRRRRRSDSARRRSDHGARYRSRCCSGCSCALLEGRSLRPYHRFLSAGSGGSRILRTS